MRLEDGSKLSPPRKPYVSRVVWMRTVAWQAGVANRNTRKHCILTGSNPWERDQRLHPEGLVRCILPILTTPGGRVVIGGQWRGNDLASNRSKYMKTKIKKEKGKKEQGILTRLLYFILACLFLFLFSRGQTSSS